MTIQVLFFGITTDLVGANTSTQFLREKATVKELRKVLVTDYSRLKNLHEYAVAVNETYAEDELELKEGDIVAIIPPVSGG